MKIIIINNLKQDLLISDKKDPLSFLNDDTFHKTAQNPPLNKVKLISRPEDISQTRNKDLSKFSKRSSEIDLLNILGMLRNKYLFSNLENDIMNNMIENYKK